MKLTLKEWAQKEYSFPPSLATLRKWASTGQIYPPATLEGGCWRVQEGATFIGLAPFNIDHSEDPLVVKVLNHGKTKEV